MKVEDVVFANPDYKIGDKALLAKLDWPFKVCTGYTKRGLLRRIA